MQAVIIVPLFNNGNNFGATSFESDWIITGTLLIDLLVQLEVLFRVRNTVQQVYLPEYVSP